MFFKISVCKTNAANEQNKASLPDCFAASAALCSQFKFAILDCKVTNK